MIGRDRCESVLRRALDASGAEDADAYLVVQDLGLTRFAANIIHQNVSHGNAQLHIRAVEGRRQGRATTNDLSDAGIAKAARSARRNALLMPEDPHFKGLPSPGAPPHVPTFDEDTASFSPDARAQMVAAACGRASAGGLESSGFSRSGVQETAAMSTKGARAYHATTFAGFLITAMSDDSASWSKGGSWRVTNVDAEALAEEAAAKARDGRNPALVEPRQYTVVLHPYAVDDLLSALSQYGMGAQAVQDERSWMSGLQNTQAMSPLVSIWDDGADINGWPNPFDAEGVPRQPVNIVREGVIGSPVHNSYTAAKQRVESTGHQFSFGGGPLASNLFMKRGNVSEAEMIASTRLGIYITRFHYIRQVHNRGCVVTGMTRDGTFLIDEGRITRPIKDLRFTQSLVEALASVEAVGVTTRLCLNEVGFTTCVPALKIHTFNFTGVTV